MGRERLPAALAIVSGTLAAHQALAMAALAWFLWQGKRGSPGLVSRVASDP